jgi:hypothetical protein
LNNSNGHNIFGNNQEPTQVDIFRAVHDTVKGVHHRTRRTAAVTLEDEKNDESADQEESINRETPDGVAWLMVSNSQHHDFYETCNTSS